MVLGAGGFIGTALVASLESQDHLVHAVTRAALPALIASRQPCGHVIGCIGLTGDFRSRPIDTAEAHVGLVARCLSELRFSSFLLLSSTRVYRRASATHEEAALPSLPADPSDLYNLTKLAGEALCLTDQRPSIRVARLSNVYGPGMPPETFLGEVLREGQLTGDVLFRQGPNSAKDYVSVAAVVRMLPAIATGRASSHLQSRRRLQHQPCHDRQPSARRSRVAGALRSRSPDGATDADRHVATRCRVRAGVKQPVSRSSDPAGS